MFTDCGNSEPASTMVNLMGQLTEAKESLETVSSDLMQTCKGMLGKRRGDRQTLANINTILSEQKTMYERLQTELNDANSRLRSAESSSRSIVTREKEVEDIREQAELSVHRLKAEIEVIKTESSRRESEVRTKYAAAQERVDKMQEELDAANETILRLKREGKGAKVDGEPSKMAVAQNATSAKEVAEAKEGAEKAKREAELLTTRVAQSEAKLYAETQKVGGWMPPVFS